MPEIVGRAIRPGYPARGPAFLRVQPPEKAADRVGGASRPRPPTPPYILAVYGGFFNVVTPHTCGPEIRGPVARTTSQTSPPSPVGYWSVVPVPPPNGRVCEPVAETPPVAGETWR